MCTSDACRDPAGAVAAMAGLLLPTVTAVIGRRAGERAGSIGPLAPEVAAAVVLTIQVTPGQPL